MLGAVKVDALLLLHTQLESGELAANWAQLTQLLASCAFFDKLMPMAEYLKTFSRKAAVEYITGRFFTPEKLAAIMAHPLYAEVTKGRLFGEKWSIPAASSACAKAFALEILAEYMTRPMLEDVCTQLGLRPPGDLDICRIRPAEAKAAPSLLPKKRAGKAAALAADAKSSHRLTSFFKPTAK